MKIQKMKEFTKLTAVATLFASTVLSLTAAPSEDGSPASGLLGQRYIQATFDWVTIDDDDFEGALGATLTLNQPLTREIDLSLSYSYLETEVYGYVDVTSQDFLLGATFHAAIDQARAFLRPELGLVRLRAGASETEVMYAVAGGVEFAIGPKVVLTPYLQWSDLIDPDFEVDGTFAFGLQADFRVNDSLSLLGQLHSNDDTDIGVSGGLAFRF